MTMPSGGPDWSSGVSKDPELSKSFNLRKLMRRPKAHGPGEQIIEGTTHESIADFVEASKVNDSQARPTIGERLRQLIRRTS